MFIKPILAGILFFKAMAIADPITLSRDDGSSQGAAYGACSPTFRQDSQMTLIQFNAVASCLLFEDNACQTTPVATLEPIMFASGTTIHKNDDNELVTHYFTCAPGQ